MLLPLMLAQSFPTLCPDPAADAGSGAILGRIVTRPLVAKMTVLGFLSAESFGSAGARFGGFFCTVLGRGSGFQRAQQAV
jgi:hypothetical protein